MQALMGSMTSTDSQSTGLTASKVGSMVFMQSEEIKKASDEYAQKVCLAVSLLKLFKFAVVFVFFCWVFTKLGSIADELDQYIGLFFVKQYKADEANILVYW